MTGFLRRSLAGAFTPFAPSRSSKLIRDGLGQMFRRLRNAFNSNAPTPKASLPRLLVGISGVMGYDWDSERVPEERLEKLVAEFEETLKLLSLTKACASQKADPKIPWTVRCQGLPGGVGGKWTTVLESANTVVFQRPAVGNPDLFEYRVYGKFPELCAGAWFHVNADDDERQLWDDTTAKLKEIDQDSVTNTRVLYWRSKYPYVKDRDYVLKKNFVLNPERKKAVLYTEDTVHPNAPPSGDAIRAERYKSIIVISADSAFETAGMEFAMYCLDDQAAGLPQIVATAISTEGFNKYIKQITGEAEVLQRTLPPSVLRAEGIIDHYALDKPGDHGARRKRRRRLIGPPRDPPSPRMPEAVRRAEERRKAARRCDEESRAIVRPSADCPDDRDDEVVVADCGRNEAS